MQTHFEKMDSAVKISYKISYNLVILPKNPNFRHFFRKMLDDFRKVRYNKNSENNVELLSLVLLSPFFCSTYVFRRWCISSGNFFDFFMQSAKKKTAGMHQFGVSPAVCFFGLFQNEKSFRVNSYCSDTPDSGLQGSSGHVFLYSESTPRYSSRQMPRLIISFAVSTPTYRTCHDSY